MRNESIFNIKKHIRFEYDGDNIKFNGLNLCNRVSTQSSILSYATSDKYIDLVNKNESIVLMIIPPNLETIYLETVNRKISYIVNESPEELFYEIHEYLYLNTNFYNEFDFPSIVSENSYIHSSVHIESGVIIEKNVEIGANTVIKKGTIIKENVHIGCNTTIGSEGFQVVNIRGKFKNIHHVGGTYISKNAYIGDNTAVCNNLFEGRLFIGENAKIDNLIHIAHNCFVGSNAVITAGSILCGSTVIGENAWIGVNSSILNNVKIGKNSMVGVGSVVLKNVLDNTLVVGVPARAIKKIN